MVVDESEILNLAYWQKKLALKALNRTTSIKRAAKVLGITERQLHNWKESFNILYDKNKDEFYEAPPKVLSTVE